MPGYATAAWQDEAEVQHGTPAGFLWERARGKTPCSMCADAYNRDKARLQRENRDHKRWLADVLQTLASGAHPDLRMLVLPEEVDAVWSILGRHLLSRNFEMTWWRSRPYDRKWNKTWYTLLLQEALSSAQIDRAEYVFSLNLTFKLYASTKAATLSGTPDALESAHHRWLHGNNVHDLMPLAMPLGYLTQRRSNRSGASVCTIQARPPTAESRHTIGGKTSWKEYPRTTGNSGTSGSPTETTDTSTT